MTNITFSTETFLQPVGAWAAIQCFACHRSTRVLCTHYFYTNNRCLSIDTYNNVILTQHKYLHLKNKITQGNMVRGAVNENLG
jgi:hypothetical protein